MILSITTDDGAVIGRVLSVQMYDLDKSFSRDRIIDDIRDAIRRGAGLATTKGEYVPSFNERNRRMVLPEGATATRDGIQPALFIPQPKAPEPEPGALF